MASGLILPEGYRSDVERVPERAQDRTFGANLPNSVADVAVPFPWERELRAVSPITGRHSHLRAYWYRTGGRWTLYDCLPKALMPPDGPPPGIPMECGELWAHLNGPPPREKHPDDCTPFVSDVQHEFWRLYGEYVRPFWVLQGDAGGHQVGFSPWQQNVLMAKGLPATPPKIGALPFAPFDGRTVRQLEHLNRLHQLDDDMDRLLKSGSKESADREMDQIQRTIREAEMAFIEQQFTPLVDMSSSLARGVNPRSEHADQLVQVTPGMAARAADAYDQYRETGDYTMKDLVGTPGNK